ncbi:MAG: diacylglycerol kinase family lipid kinase [Chloroflexi bacterium]|jgi:diacylglycerol kinase (ATP)|nr:diacylglycerol kinase family lipid kinase [Chloroflexota bacterium]MBT3670504.1 diacylglycerol kinase family lipid kinase [Chloroflexota bacterium]MBT4003722.1 diacylglycerol kinase family lipid kinase [Chloroflexota bacterium]MBT4306488.1 diacylglycerol kinase family lipid kinase [Chloroflexota bacterium]MBT4534891.1 diacylglycerol kinase family lipid kinase [Chloroflexota bacterium]
MKKDRIKLILNPNADMGNAWKKAADLRYIAESYGEVSWAGTVFPTHAKELAHQAALEGYDLVIAVGGDGTAHEVINGLMEVPEKKRPKFSIVPLGSGNDYAANLGLPKKPEEALMAILTGKTKKFDLALIEDETGRQEYWDNTINIGFGGNVTIFSHNLPILRGFMMYLVAVIQTILMRYDVLDVKITIDDDKVWQNQSMMICLCNGPREGGGFITAPGAELDDGDLNYSFLGKVSRLMMFRMIPEFMNGTQEKFEKIVHPGKFKKMVIESKQPLILHTDGEVFAGLSHDVHMLKVEVLPDAIEVVVPSE